MGRVGFVDISSDNPDNVLHVHPEPVLDVGEPGLYNDSGVAPTSFLSADGRDLLYIFGFQRCEKLGVLMFAGLAEKAAEEEKFRPPSRAPILPRTPDRPFMQSAPTFIKDGEGYRMWYPYVSEWRVSSLRSYPVYQIGHAVSENGLYWRRDENLCLTPSGGQGMGFGDGVLRSRP